MIRATIRNGTIQPLDPLPPDWLEGHPLLIEDADQGASTVEVEVWFQEVERAVSAIRCEDHQRLEAALAEADRVAKDQMRKEMGLAG